MPADDVQYPIGVPIEVCDLFEKIALEIKEAGWRRYSARAILHRIRWHYHMERQQVAFKANNNWTPSMSRWAMEKHPELLEDFFETRERTGKAAEWIDA
jgi:hypothetical protein